MSFNIQFDYRFDTANFFSDPARRAALEAAADQWENVISDDFDDLAVGLEFSITNPTTNGTENITLTSAVDDIIVFVGARSLAGSTLGRAGPTGYSADGDIFSSRISDNFRGQGVVTDFEPWAGTLVFDTGANWNFDLGGPVSGQNDFLSIAVHEIGHILGIGTSAAFDALASGGDFYGVNAMASNGGSPIPLHSDDSHVEDGFNGNSVSLDPTLTTGTRVLVSETDKAILADIGYQVAGYTAQGSQPAIATNSGETIFGTILNDVINGLAGSDQIQGEHGNDLLQGGAGNDTLFGQDGDDTLEGGANDDQIQGGSGNDDLRGGAGVDALFGQSGVDTFVVGQGDGANTVSDMDLSNEVIRLVDSGFTNMNEVLAAISKPFSNVSRLTLPDGTTVDVFHGSQSGSPLNASHFELSGGGGGGGGNSAPVGNVLISGIATQGHTLVANVGGLSDADGLGSFGYLWLRNGTAISGAMASQYTLSQTDVDAQISLRVTYTDGGATFETVTSAKTSSVQNINDAPTGAVTVSGTAIEGGSLTANTGSIGDADGLGSFSYAWLRDGQTTGATGISYQIGAADIGAQMSVRVSYTDQRGAAETLTSGRSAVVQNQNDAPQGAVTVLGNALEGETLTANAAGLSDADGLGTFTYTWLRDGSSFGVTGQSYTLAAADIGSSLSVRVTFVDGQGTFEAVTSAATGAVQNVNSSSSGGVSVTGDLVQGGTLTAVTDALQDADGLGPFVYSWLRDGGLIAGADAASYVLTQQDVGARIALRVSYLDGQGTFESVTGAETTLIGNVNDAPVGVPQVSGQPGQNVMLTADTSSLADADGLGSFSYTWLRDGVTIPGAGSVGYQLTEADVDAQMSVRVTYTDGFSTFETVVSALTSVVQNVNDAPTGQPMVTGTASQNAELNTDISGIDDPDGLGSFSYAWLRDGFAIGGADDDTYHLTQADVGSQISVRVSFTDGQGSAESLTSTATAVVTNVNDAPVGAPAILGTFVQGQRLTIASNAVTDADGLGAFSYQWLRDGTIMTGSVGASYDLAQADVGTQISVRLSYIDGGGTSEQVTSLDTVVITNSNDSPTGSITLEGVSMLGQTLTIGTAMLGDDDGLGELTYSWLRNSGTIAGATEATYTLTADDLAAVIRARVSYTDGFGTTESATSAATSSVISGDSVLAGDDGNNLLQGGPGDDLLFGGAGSDALEGGAGTDWFDIGPGDDTIDIRDFEIGVDTIDLTSFDRADALAAFYGAGSDLVLQFNDGTVLKLAGPGLTQATFSLADIAFAFGNLQPEGDIAVGGAAFVGRTLTADTTGVSDGDGINLASAQVQWLRDGTPISGVTGLTYVLAEADLGASISVAYIFEDNFGISETVTSAASAPVTFASMTMSGDAGPNALIGTDGGDILSGMDGNDTVTGGRGDDQINGGNGADTAAYTGNQTSYTLTLSPTGTRVTDRRTDGNGSDELIDIEFLDFDTDLFGGPFNLGVFGGPAGLSAAELESFVELYIAYFNRAPDAVGLNFWGTQFVVNRLTLEEMAALFGPQDETLATYPPGTSNEEFASSVYQNVLGRDPDIAGFNFWVGQLDAGNFTPDQFILQVLRGVESGSPDREYLDSKVELGAYFAVHKGLSNVTDASDAMALYDGTQASITATVNAIDSYYADALDALNGEFLMPLIGVLDDPFAL